MALEKALKRNIEKQTPAEVGSEAEDILYDKQNRAMFETAISRLPPRQRLVYRMSRQQGFTREQIAGRLHISPNTVKNHLQQAILFIRAYFKAGASASLWVVFLQSFKIIFDLFGSH
jgi:RNA polymerase sigma-70 factor (ECF subfamily)